MGHAPQFKSPRSSMFMSVAYDDPQLQVEYLSPKNAFRREAEKGWLYFLPCCPCGGFEGSVVKLSILFDEFFPPPGRNNHHPLTGLINPAAAPTCMFLERENMKQ